MYVCAHTRARAREHTHTHRCRATFRNGTAEPAFRSRAERRGRTSQREPRRTPGTSSVASRLCEPATATGTSSYPPCAPLAVRTNPRHARKHARICTYASKHSPSMHGTDARWTTAQKCSTVAPRVPELGSPLPHLHRNWAHPRSHLGRNWARPAHICTRTELPLLPRVPHLAAEWRRL